MSNVSNPVFVVERPGRRPCGDCGGEPGFPCLTCGGCGSTFTEPTCLCSRALARNGWHDNLGERLPRYFCDSGHQIAIRFTAEPQEEVA